MAHVSGPFRIVDCPDCEGEGRVASGVMSWPVNTTTIDPPYDIGKPCPTCGGHGVIEDELPEISEAEFFEDYAPATGEATWRAV